MNGVSKSDLLSFEKLIAPRVMRIVYFIGLIAVAIAGLVAFIGSFAAMRMSVLTGMGTMVLAVIGTALAALFWRIGCEVSIAFFNVHDRVGELRDRVNTLSTGTPSTGIGRHAGSAAS